MTPEEVMEKIRAYRMSDEELGRVNEMLQEFVGKLGAEFGPRTGIMVANLCASRIAHDLVDPDEGYFVMDTVNDWLRVTARNHGGFRFRLSYSVPDEDEQDDDTTH
jgi:hypothetical protein